MAVLASLLLFMGTASIVIAADHSTLANAKVSSRTFVDKEAKPRPQNVTELIIPNGQSADLKCPLQGQNPMANEVYLYSAAYGINFGASKPSDVGCRNIKITPNVKKICLHKPSCKVTAHDPSQGAGCRNRSLRVQYICVDPTIRGAMMSKLMD